MSAPKRLFTRTRQRAPPAGQRKPPLVALSPGAAGLILEPMPVSAWSLCCVTALLATKACTFSAAMSGLLNDSIWLITIAFFVAKVSGASASRLLHRAPLAARGSRS